MGGALISSGLAQGTSAARGHLKYLTRSSSTIVDFWHMPWKNGFAMVAWAIGGRVV